MTIHNKQNQQGGGNGVYDTQGTCVNCGEGVYSSSQNTHWQLPKMPVVCGQSFYPLNVSPPVPMVDQQNGGGNYIWDVQGVYGQMHPDVQGGQQFTRPTHAPTVCKHSLFPINGTRKYSVKCSES